MILDQENIVRIKKALRYKSKGMSISEIASQLQMNRNSVAKYLEILSMNGEVESKKLGTSRVYFVSQKLPISGWIKFSSDMIVIFNPEGQVLQVNDPFLRFCKLADDEITGIDIRRLNNPLFHDIPLDHFIHNESAEKKTEYFEISLPSDGEEFYFRVKVVPVVFDDRTEGIMVIFEDVSEQRRTEMALAEREQQYRTVLENIQDVFYRSDNDGNLIMASPSWASMLGYDSLEECLGKNIADVFYWEPEKRKPFREMVYTHGKVNDYEVVLKTKNGRPFYVSTNSHLYFDDSGTILGIEGIFRDMNERHASAEKIQRHIDQMEFFSRALQEFIELSPKTDIFEKIASDLKVLVADAMISVNSYDNENGTLTCRSCLGEDDREACMRCLGRDPRDIIFPVNPLAFRSLQTGRLQRIPFPLFEVLFGEISQETCDQINTTLNLGDIYCIGFVRHEILLGNAVLFLRKNAGSPDIPLIETYARAASISLQRKIAEDSLRESQEIFRSVAQESPFPLVIIDNNGYFRYINHSFTRIFGYELADFRSDRQWFLLAFPEPEYRKRVIELWKSDIAIYPDQGTIPREFMVRCKDGTTKNIIFRAMVLPNNERCVICEDITEIRESGKLKQLLSSIVESSNDAIVGKKIDGSIISWNRAAEEMYGFSRREILGKNISLIVPFERRNELENILKQISQGQGVSGLETQRIKKDGTLINVSVTISPIIDDTGSVIGASTISHDITHQKQILSQIQDFRHQLKDIIEFLPDPTFIIDQEHRIIAWNSAIELMTGVGKDDILGHIEFSHAFSLFGTSQPVLLDLIDAPDEIISSCDPPVTRSGNTLSSEWFIPSLYSGRGAYLRVRASSIFDSENRRIGAIETIQDISEDKELQELLRSAHNGIVSDSLMKSSIPVVRSPADPILNEGKDHGILSLLYLSNALKMAQDSISILDLSGRCIWVNDAFTHTVSAGKGDVLTGNSFARLIAPEDRKNALDCLRNIRKSGNKRIGLSLLTPSGRVPAEASFSSICDSGGGVLGYLSIIRLGEAGLEKLQSKKRFH
jgi:PAS domain S-box-containing protein